MQVYFLNITLKLPLNTNFAKTQTIESARALSVQKRCSFENIEKSSPRLFWPAQLEQCEFFSRRKPGATSFSELFHEHHRFSLHNNSAIGNQRNFKAVEGITAAFYIETTEKLNSKPWTIFFAFQPEDLAFFFDERKFTRSPAPHVGRYGRSLSQTKRLRPPR